MEKYPRPKTFMGFKVIEDDRVPLGFIEIRDQDGRAAGHVFIGYPAASTTDTAPPVTYLPLER